MQARDGGSRPPYASTEIQSCHTLDLTSIWNTSGRDDKVGHSHCTAECLLNYRRFDAFRSIFPAGTVSGAPKIKAMEIISELEQEKRAIYAGAVGRFDFADDAMDTCIAIRTMTFKDGVAYLQAGGGIVFDSVEEDEYIETVNKLGGNTRALAEAESKFCYFSSSTSSSAKLQSIGMISKGSRRRENRTLCKLHFTPLLHLTKPA